MSIPWVERKRTKLDINYLLSRILCGWAALDYGGGDSDVWKPDFGKPFSSSEWDDWENWIYRVWCRIDTQGLDEEEARLLKYAFEIMLELPADRKQANTSLIASIRSEIEGDDLKEKLFDIGEVNRKRASNAGKKSKADEIRDRKRFQNWYRQLRDQYSDFHQAHIVNALHSQLQDEDDGFCLYIRGTLKNWGKQADDEDLENGIERVVKDGFPPQNAKVSLANLDRSQVE